MAADLPVVTGVPGLSLPGALDVEVDPSQVTASAVALAYRLRPEKVDPLPMDVEVTVVTARALQTFHYGLSEGRVEISREAAFETRVKLTLQKGIDLVLMENGLSIMAIVAAGRATLAGGFQDILGVFGNASYPLRDGRRSFSELSQLLLECQSANSRDIARIVDRFGREDFARELVYFFSEAATLSGLPLRLPAATIRFIIGGIPCLSRITPEGSSVLAMTDGTPFDATIEVPKMETVVDRLLGRIGEMDAILSRKMLVAGPGIDDLMPLFEQISTGLTVFTSSVFASSAQDSDDWSFPAEMAVSEPSDDRIREALGHEQTEIDMTTTGRASGKPRRLEIVLHNINGRLYISGRPRPERRQWLDNLAKDPHLTIHLKRGVRADLRATAREITDPTERRRVLEGVARHWQRNDVDTMVEQSPLIEITLS